MEIGTSGFWHTTKGYFSILILFWIGFGFIWFDLGYEGSFLTLNQYHWPPNDYASLYFFTHLADGAILPAIFILLFWRKDPALVMTAILAIYMTGILSQAGKMTIFDDWSRPAAIFEGVPGVDIFAPHPPKRHSFPSGHATSSATGGLFFAYAFGSIKRWLGIAVGFFTVFLCYTRVTLGVHFPADILVGSIIGSIGGSLILLTLYSRLSRWQSSKKPELWKRWEPLVYGIAILGFVGQFTYLIFKI